MVAILAAKSLLEDLPLTCEGSLQTFHAPFDR